MAAGMRSNWRDDPEDKNVRIIEMLESLELWRVSISQIYMPSNTKASSEKGKWDSPTSIGDFAGYRIKPGYT